jgi:MoaA/NifB/PqqE/SkfB family radical SAM enzyme
MTPHLIFCSDLARRDPARRAITRLEGWCIASAPIRGLYFYHRDIKYEQLPHGFSRPDVAAAYPAYSGTERPGFCLTTASALLTAHAELFVQLDREMHRVPVNLETREIQRFELGETTLVTEGLDELEDTAAFERRFRRSLDKTPGLTLRLDIINKCNLRCVMCHFSDDAVFRRPTRQLTTEEFKTLFDQIGPSVREVMLSCGDEPLVSKHLPAILEYLAGEHPRVAIGFCTNAMLMHGPVRDTIMRTKVARLLFSIDAVSKSLLEEIRAGCRYEQVLGNIIALRDLRRERGTSRPAFVFNFVMMNRNIHEAPSFVRLAKSLGAEYIDFRHMVPIGTYYSPDDLLSEQPGKYNFYREQIAAAADEYELPVYLPPPFVGAPIWNPPADEPLLDWSDFERLAPGPPDLNPRSVSMPAIEGSVAEEFATTFCNRPFSEIMVRDQNEVLPCPFHEKPLGLLSEGKTLAEIFHGEAFQRLRRNMLRPEGDPACVNCPIKSQHLPINAA